MSAEAVGWVYRHSPFTGLTFAVHLAIGDSVNDQHHNEFWMLMHKLAKKARTTRARAQKAVQVLVHGGFLERLESGGGRSRPSLYRFSFPDVPVLYESRPQSASRRHSSSRETVPRGSETVPSRLESVPSGHRHTTQGTQENPKRLTDLVTVSDHGGGERGQKTEEDRDPEALITALAEAKVP